MIRKLLLFLCAVVMPVVGNSSAGGVEAPTACQDIDWDRVPAASLAAIPYQPVNGGIFG